MMKQVFLSGAAAILLGGCSAGTTSEPALGLIQAPVRTAPATSGDFASQVLAEHNRARSAVRARPLAWSAELAAGAQAHAAQLARTGQLIHSSRQSRPGQGENLWMGTAGAYSTTAMVQNWAGERRFFRPGIFPNVSTTGNWADVAHYTQMIWAGTTTVGCAVQRSGRWDALVCRYSPAGNRDGQAVP
jgi:hypothetical protein